MGEVKLKGRRQMEEEGKGCVGEAEEEGEAHTKEERVKEVVEDREEEPDREEEGGGEVEMEEEE